MYQIQYRIFVDDHTRVVLPTDNGPSDYINANHIMGYKEKANAYLATQGPKDWTIEDVWRMVWQEKTNTVVMLANLYELGKEKCSRYWPEKGKTQTWGHFIAESISEEQFADYVIREFTLKNQELKKMRKIRQLHFTVWPDKGTPEYAYPLLAFHRKVHSFDSERRGPLLVHCSAGVGRTGTFIAIDILIQQAAAEGKVDIFNCVNLLRTQRMDMVQTLAQYVFVFQALVDSSEDSVIPCYQLTQSFSELCQGNKLYEQFKRLNALKTLTKNHTSAALQPNNVEKNRIIEIIPDDQHRPYLVTPWKEGTNYINAVCVHGFKQRNAYILTQSPMTTTVVDMWRLLNDHESRAVIMLDNNDVTDDCAVYWPTKEAPTCQYGPFEVELTETNFSENHNVTMRDFKLTKSSKPGDGATVVRQSHLKRNSWNKDESVPSNKTVLLDLLDDGREVAATEWKQTYHLTLPVSLPLCDGVSPLTPGRRCDFPVVVNGGLSPFVVALRQSGRLQSKSVASAI
ncbi:Receptor-type tyrosine-protein phosphatase mu [Lamellibrachia satsuma]|nr:Receptor-type tyrosine-protein phosphatase mu [Lamellibrachia satsuma]